MATQNFQNPPFDLSKRNLVSYGSPRFKEIIKNLIHEFSKTNPMYYCTKHHSIETRNTSKQQRHDNCTFLTKAETIGNVEN